jgi:hypothetical protein
MLSRPTETTRDDPHATPGTTTGARGEFNVIRCIGLCDAIVAGS